MLTPGQLTMFSAYPDTYKIHVYETGGDCKYLPEIKAISQTNGTMINDNEGLRFLMRVKFLSQTHQKLNT